MGLGLTFYTVFQINSKLQHYELLSEQSTHGSDYTMHFKFL